MTDGNKIHLILGHSQFNDASFYACGLSDLILSVFGGKNPNLHYMLYTRSNPHNACELQPTDKALKKCNFNPRAETKVIVHGWLYQLTPEAPEFVLKDKLLQVDNYNVVVFNWTYYTNTKYKRAVARSFGVGLTLSSWIRFLKVKAGAKLKDFHIISHSLGTEVTSYAARLLCKLIGHITYLESAALTFRDLPDYLHPHASDALYTDSMHTDGGNVSFYRPIADIDYYVNGGRKQPSCYYGAKYIAGSGMISTVNDSSSRSFCSHDMSLQYYIASVDKSCKFLGLICDSYEDFTSGKCSSENAPVCRMGFYSKRQPNLPVHSKCYVNTSVSPPYCLN